MPPEVICVLDAKRGDIGTTAERYAAALFGHLEADAVTLSPYLGEDAIEPFLAHDGRIVYVLPGPATRPRRDPGRSVGDGEPIHCTSRAGRPSAGPTVASAWSSAPRRPRSWRDPRAVPARHSSCPASAPRAATSRRRRSTRRERAPGLVSVSRGIAGASRGADWRAAAARRPGPVGADARRRCYTRRPAPPRGTQHGGSRSNAGSRPMELILLLVIVLIIFGPGKLPDIGNAVG